MPLGDLENAVPAAVPGSAPLILFGAADRHNFGDLLLARIAEAEAATGALAGIARIGVRDVVTQRALADLGVSALLEPDPAVRVMQHFAGEIAARRDQPLMVGLRRAFPCGYAAVQFAAEFGDNASLCQVADTLAALPAGCGVVCFRAGAALWHDRLDVYARLGEQWLAAQGRAMALFRSLHIFDITALIAGARCVLATSLHVGIVARRCGVPFTHLPLGGTAQAKWLAWAATWPDFAGTGAGRQLAGR